MVINHRHTWVCDNCSWVANTKRRIDPFQQANLHEDRRRTHFTRRVRNR